MGEPEPDVAKYRYRAGGLMRCCTQTLGVRFEDLPVLAEQGALLPCNWCSQTMRYRDEAWEWNHD